MDEAVRPRYSFCRSVYVQIMNAYFVPVNLQLGEGEGSAGLFCCQATRFRLIRRGRVLLLSGDHAPGSRMSVHTPTFFHVHAGDVLVARVER